MKSLVIGASGGLGRCISEELASLGHDLLLVGTDHRDLLPIKSDLEIRYGIKAYTVVLNLASFELDEFTETVLTTIGLPNNILFISGLSDSEDKGPFSDQQLIRVLDVNFMSGVRIINRLIPEMPIGEPVNLVGAGSVASIRPRKSNSAYGAAKTGLEFYFGTVRHHWASENAHANVQFYRLGYLETGMTFGQKLLFPVLSPEKAARTIAGNLNKDIGVVYLPRWWQLISMALNFLPWRVFRKLDI